MIILKVVGLMVLGAVILYLGIVLYVIKKFPRR